MTTATTSKPARKASSTTKKLTVRSKAVPPKDTPTSRGSRATNLVIVESPAKARTVGNILGDDYVVI
ncbi:MAG: hypothetical protein ABI305_03500, partial [Tepidiformaceae bacterium]